MAKPRVFSGVQPTGEFHIGKLARAVRTWAQQVADQKGDLSSASSDAHAITVDYEAAELAIVSTAMACDLVTCGVDPERCTLSSRADVPRTHKSSPGTSRT